MNQSRNRGSSALMCHIAARVTWVATVIVDPWRGYLRPVRRLLPRAQVVVDHFHLIRLANQVVTEVRQRTQQDVTGHRGRKGDPEAEPTGSMAEASPRSRRNLLFTQLYSYKRHGCDLNSSVTSRYFKTPPSGPLNTPD